MVVIMVIMCSVPSCDFQTQDVTEALTIALLTNHGLAHRETSSSPILFELEFEHKEHCVSDNIHYDTELEQHWWRTINFLTTVGQPGIVLNPDNFQFAGKSIDFTGFQILDVIIEPFPNLDAI